MKKSISVLFLYLLSSTQSISLNMYNRQSIIRSLPLLASANINLDDDTPKPPQTIIQSDNNDLYFYGPVSQESTTILRTQLVELDKKSRTFELTYNSPPPPINLHIQSGGGSLLHTYYIVDLIKNLETPVYTYIDGFAASAATLISVAGDKRFMTKNSMMLIHQLSSQNSGKFLEIEDDMSNLKTMMALLKKIYLENTNLTEEILTELLRKDLWLTSDICLEYGLVDKII